MKLISVRDLKPEMIVAKPIFNENGICLIGEKFVLNERVIERIKELKLEKIWVYNDFQEINNYLISELKLRLISSIESIYNCDNSSKKYKLKLIKYKETIEMVLDWVLRDDICIRLLDEIKTYSEEVFKHSVDVARVSLIIGLNLDFDTSKLINLCKAALLHDIGKVETDSERLKNLTRPKKESHSKLGYMKLKNINKFNSSIYLTVLEHHERYDETKCSSNIKKNIFARIVNVANVYSNMTRAEAGKEKYSKSETLEYLFADCSRQFDPELINKFASNFPLYEVGQLVRLSNGKDALVVKNNESCLSRPIVRVITENKGLGEEIDLTSSYNITIL